MASVDGLNLVEEVIRIHNWTERFAKAAKDEYFRYLELKGRAQDFRSAKLAPSPTVALVWSVHRQWTLDYEMTCTRYGGFIHHFPLSMRDMALRKEAYAATLEAYERVFGQRAPELCWEPFGKPSNGVSPALDAMDPSETPAPAMDQAGLSQVEIELPVYLGGEVEGAPQKTPDTAPRPRKNPIAGKITPARKSTEKAMRMAGLVLRPLRPGETRTRGRPRRSDYVPIAELSAEDRAKVEARLAAAAAPPGGPGYSPSELAARVAQGLGPGPLGPNAIPMKRGRGRPRKDGSWPIPRALQNAQLEAARAQLLAQSQQIAQNPPTAQAQQAAQTAPPVKPGAAQMAPLVKPGAAQLTHAVPNVAAVALEVSTTDGPPAKAEAVASATVPAKVAPALAAPIGAASVGAVPGAAAPAAAAPAAAAPAEAAPAEAAPAEAAPAESTPAPQPPQASAVTSSAAGGVQDPANVAPGGADENKVTSQSLTRAVEIPQNDQSATGEPTPAMVDVGVTEQPGPAEDSNAQHRIRNAAVATGLAHTTGMNALGTS